MRYGATPATGYAIIYLFAMQFVTSRPADHAQAAIAGVPPASAQRVGRRVGEAGSRWRWRWLRGGA